MSRCLATRVFLAGTLLLACMPRSADARTARLHVARVDSPVAVLENVDVRLEWPTGADAGQLWLTAGVAHAPALGYRFRRLEWRCPLQRSGTGWQCEGPVRAEGSGSARLAIRLDEATTSVVLQRGRARLSLDRTAASPELTRIDLRDVPARWAQALAETAWHDVQLGEGRLEGEVRVDSGQDDGLGVAANLALEAFALDTPDGRVAAGGLGAHLNVEGRFGADPRVQVDGVLHGGEMLFGNAYVSLADRDVPIEIGARRVDGGGWALEGLQWHDGDRLDARGRAELAADGGLAGLEAAFESESLQGLGESYLGGWLGVLGLADIRLSGGAQGSVRLDAAGLESAVLELQRAGIADPRGRFAFEGLEGEARFSSGPSVASGVRWAGLDVYGIHFGPGELPLSSAGGVLAGRGDVVLDVLDGRMRVEDIRIRPPGAQGGLDVRFGLALEALDIATLSGALGWPAFNGQLSGRIPQAHYADDRLALDGGLRMQLFEGEVAVSSLSMERPFGVLPTLSADIALDGLDLESLTGVFGFGSISGRLHGRIDHLRLLDWSPVAFDAELHTEKTRGVRQRISQRAVQDLSSVGDASFMGSLQGQLIGLFDDFGYARIGIGCTLADEVCEMQGLRSDGRGFTIVEGSGVPRLTVVGYNRRVHWPTLVERLAAVGSGEVAPVVD
ncbi:hypothetical protein H4F99_11000 [Lysobacter sp. SG-8]|uniref:Dicarboxylate transport domain-containing protein n=1 Tax=Marilutibacter penaei TaxID=2759900 RepID=A0A7W3U4V4_9GAMM|nr:hypothetical protein [Lysobacter penaei]